MVIPSAIVILSTIVILSEAKDLVVEVFGCKSRSFASLRMGINAKKSWFLAWAERPKLAKLGVGRSPARVLLFITGLPC